MSPMRVMEIYSPVLFRFESTTGLGYSYEYSTPYPFSQQSGQCFNRRPLMRFMRVNITLTLPLDSWLNPGFLAILRDSESQLINIHDGKYHLILALCWVLNRFIATIELGSGLGLVTGLRFLGLRQPRVRAKFRLYLKFCPHLLWVSLQTDLGWSSDTTRLYWFLVHTTLTLFLKVWLFFKQTVKSYSKKEACSCIPSLFEYLFQLFQWCFSVD